MTPKQDLFVREYLVDLSAPQAAKRAGYGGRSSAKLMRTPVVLAKIRQAQAERAANLAVSAERVLAEYARIAFANMADFEDFGPDGLTLKDMAALTPEQTAVIAEVTETKTSRGGVVRFKLHDKLAALNALARHIGLAAPEKLALTDSTGADLPPPDPSEIARQIAFALRQGIEDRAGSDKEQNKKKRSDRD